MESEKRVATNEFDVKVAEINSNLEKFQFEKGSEILKIREQGMWKTKRLEKITSSTERVLLGGLVLAGVMYVTDKRYEIMDTAFNSGE